MEKLVHVEADGFFGKRTLNHSTVLLALKDQIQNRLLSQRSERMKIHRLLLLSVMLTFLFSCAQTVAMRGSSEVPAAVGEAKVSKDDNGNSVVAIEVSYLAPPENLTPRKAVYVVWAQAPQGRTVNLGQMTVSANRVGEFRGITPLHQFRILVTAEDIPAVATPSKQEIFTTEIFTVS